MKAKIKYKDIIRIYNKLPQTKKRFTTVENLLKPGILNNLNKKPNMFIKFIRFCLRFFTNIIWLITNALKLLHLLFVDTLKLYKKYIFPK